MAVGVGNAFAADPTRLTKTVDLEPGGKIELPIKVGICMVATSATNSTFALSKQNRTQTGIMDFLWNLAPDYFKINDDSATIINITSDNGNVCLTNQFTNTIRIIVLCLSVV